MTYRQSLIALLLLICSFVCVSAFAAEADEDDSGIDRQQVYHLYEDVSLLPINSVQYDKPRVVAKFVYPKIVSESPNQAIDEFNQTVDAMLKKVVVDFKKQIAESGVDPATLPKAARTNTLNVDFNSSVINTDSNSPIVSIRFTVEGYVAGMAHPFHYHLVLNYDLAIGEKIELNDLFKDDSNYLAVLSDYSRNALAAKLSDKEMLDEGTSPTLENFKNWNVNPRGLQITFDETQIAPYSYGTQTVLIPYDVIKELLVSESPITDCFIHRKRCARNNLLTGGFIDQAVNTKHSALNPRLSKV